MGSGRAASQDDPSEQEIAAAIHHLLSQRSDDKTICPSDAARAVLPDGDWRGLMPAVRAVAADEVRAGRLEVRQGGEAVDPATARGPIRLGRAGAPEGA